MYGVFKTLYTYTVHLEMFTFDLILFIKKKKKNMFIRSVFQK